jgi:hypothetical protein
MTGEYSPQRRRDHRDDPQVTNRYTLDPTLCALCVSMGEIYAKQSQFLRAIPCDNLWSGNSLGGNGRGLRRRKQSQSKPIPVLDGLKPWTVGCDIIRGREKSCTTNNRIPLIDWEIRR